MFLGDATMTVYRANCGAGCPVKAANETLEAKHACCVLFGTPLFITEMALMVEVKSAGGGFVSFFTVPVLNVFSVCVAFIFIFAHLIWLAEVRLPLIPPAPLANTTHSLTPSLPLSLTHSLPHSLSHLLTHSVTPSLTRSLTHSLTPPIPTPPFIAHHQRNDNGAQFPHRYYRGIEHAIWWATVTVTTVGYGDKAPKT
jgi:hypothetical protein